MIPASLSVNNNLRPPNNRHVALLTRMAAFASTSVTAVAGASGGKSGSSV